MLMVNGVLYMWVRNVDLNSVFQGARREWESHLDRKHRGARCGLHAPGSLSTFRDQLHGKTLYLVFSGNDAFSVRKATLFTRDSIASDPEIASVLADRAASDKFWRDLESLLDARVVIGEARYLDLGLKMAEEYW